MSRLLLKLTEKTTMNNAFIAFTTGTGFGTGMSFAYLEDVPRDEVPEIMVIFSTIGFSAGVFFPALVLGGAAYSTYSTFKL